MSEPATTGYAQVIERKSIYDNLGGSKNSELTLLTDLRQMPYRERLKKASKEQFEAHPELFTKPKIYIASKAKHRPHWRRLRDDLGFNIISQWIDTDDEFLNDDEGLNYATLWEGCVQDAKDCDVLILYVERR
jgi:hypothetical protein